MAVADMSEEKNQSSLDHASQYTGKCLLTEKHNHVWTMFLFILCTTKVKENCRHLWTTGKTKGKKKVQSGWDHVSHYKGEAKVEIPTVYLYSTPLIIQVKAK